jgi:hypothetical protein
MSEQTFLYSPTSLPSRLRQDDRTVFASLYPMHHSWLRERNISFQVSGYYWPTLVAMMVHPELGEVYQMQLVVPSEHADAFAQFAGMVPGWTRGCRVLD